MPQTTHTEEFNKLGDNERMTVAHIINMVKPDGDIIEEQRGITEEKLKPIEDEKILDHLHKIACGYLGEDVKFGKLRKAKGIKLEKLKENSIDFDL